MPKAAEYYRRFFRFEEVFRDEQGGTALVQGHGVSMLLRQAATTERSLTDHGGPLVPDAVLLVERPERMRRELDDLGAHLLRAEELRPHRRRFFGFSDCYGNVVAAGPAAGVVLEVKRWVRDPADALGFVLREQRRGRLEAGHGAEFRAFYEGLADKRDIYYLLITSGLLHWAAKALSYVPEHVNLVLVGSDLLPDELAWARSQAGRPFHHIGLRLDDAAAWELLFDVNRRHFGWIDPGCFVLDGQLFGELALIDPDTSLNCAWSWDGGHGFPIASTHLVFVNVNAVSAVRRRGVRASPGIYSYQRLNRQVEGRRCYARTPSRAEVRMLHELWPAGESGRPAPPRGLPYFDTLVMYQLLARRCGFSVTRIRELESLGHVRGRTVEDEGSDELFYIGALSHADALEEFSGYFHDQEVRLLYLIAEYVTLAEAAHRLPGHYQQRRNLVAAELGGHGLEPAAIAETARRHLMEVQGMSAKAADAVLRGASPPGAEPSR